MDISPFLFLFVCVNNQFLKKNFAGGTLAGVFNIGIPLLIVCLQCLLFKLFESFVFCFYNMRVFLFMNSQVLYGALPQVVGRYPV